ncbi:MAG: hypothetical protein WC767_03640 [Candidatus Paceibacterota bacterium]|jgi:hypothetical protein
MANIKKIAEDLRKGDIAAAAKAREAMNVIKDEMLRLEVTEIAKQAMIQHLKAGETKTAKKIEKLFSIPSDMFEDTIIQAVLSSFREGDVETVKRLREKLPIQARLRADILAYCSTWGKEDVSLLMERVLA